ncbi:MAG TPA: type II secretion system protein [Gemmatimonadaceae bacterium]|nr:type II secretion system protein [Gemmatimonadaceae bacterium]
MTTSSSRRGFTLAELLVVMVVLGIVLAALMGVIVRQQRFYRGATAMIETQNNVRDAVDVLQSELRGISPSLKDIYSMTDTSIEFREPIASAVVCDISLDRKTITVPPVDLAAKNGLTSWASAPESGDSLFVYDPGSSTATSDDSWYQYALTSDPVTGGTCAASTNFTTVAEAGQAWTVTLDSALTTTMILGSAIRIFRKAHYSLYKASDGQWYLGYFDCGAGSSGCATIQPISGPYLPPASDGTGGLTFTYYNSAGSVTTDPLSVARIDIVTRSQSSSDIGHLNGTPTSHTDSLRTSIALRN